MLRSVFRSPVTAVVLLVAAAALIVFGTLGAAGAAPRIVSNDYRAEAQLTNIHVALTENGVVRENMDQDAHVHESAGYQHTLLTTMLDETDGRLEPGHAYKEVLAARNVGVSSELGIDQYVRATVYKYWVDENGKKCPGLDPSLIDLHFVEGNGWTIDKAASTDERTVLYYRNPTVADHDWIATGEDTTPFVDALTIDESVLTAKGDDGTLAYKNKSFEIKAVVDAVQTHNDVDAMTGAWGRTV